MFDTDGSVGVEYTKINRAPQYRISIVSCSHELIKECGEILSELDIRFEIRTRENKSLTRNNAPYSELRIRRKDDIKKWFEKIGTKNIKHERKYKSGFNMKPTLNQICFDHTPPLTFSFQKNI